MEHADKRMLAGREARTCWLAEIIPNCTFFMTQLETFYVLDEATPSSIYGNFVALILLAASFVEHWFTASFSQRGYHKEASRGLSVHPSTSPTPTILGKAGNSRLIRTPFVHLKPSDHKHTICRRSIKLGDYSKSVLEEDVKEAVIAMYSVTVHALSRDPRINLERPPQAAWHFS